MRRWFSLTLACWFVLALSYGVLAQPVVTVMQNWPKGFGDRDPDYETRFWGRAEQELGIKINMEYAPSHDDYLEKLPVMVATGTAPDLVLYAAGSHRILDIFEPLDTYIERSGFPIDDFLSNALDNWMKDGQLVALPTSRNHNMWLYNADMLQEAGIPDLPVSWGSDPGWTWDYVREIGPKLMKYDGDDVVRYGVSGLATDIIWPNYFDADWVDADLNLTIDAQETVAAMEYFVDLAQSAFVGGSMTEGSAAMGSGMSWTVNTYMASGLNFKWAPMPRGTREMTIVYTDGAAILRASENKDLAWQLLEWLFQPENAVGFYTQQWNYLVPMRGIQHEWFEQMRDRMGSHLDDSHYGQVLFEAGPYGYISPLMTDLKFTSLWPLLNSGGDDNPLFSAALTPVIDGEISVVNYLTNAQSVLSALLEEQ